MSRLHILLVVATSLGVANAGCPAPNIHCASELSERATGKAMGSPKTCACPKGDKDCKSAWVCVTSVGGVPIHNGPWPCHLCFEPPTKSGKGTCQSCPAGFYANWFFCDDKTSGTKCTLLHGCCDECPRGKYSTANNRNTNKDSACKDCKGSSNPICQAAKDKGKGFQRGGWTYTPVCTQGIWAKGTGRYTTYSRTQKIDGTKATLGCKKGYKVVIPKDGSDTRKCKCTGNKCKWETDAKNKDVPTCTPICKVGCTQVSGSCVASPSDRRLSDDPKLRVYESPPQEHFLPDFVETDADHRDVDHRKLQYRNKVCELKDKCKDGEADPVGDRSCDFCKASCDSSCDDGTGAFKDKGPNPGCDFSCDEDGPCIGSCDNCCQKCPLGKWTEPKGVNKTKVCVGCAKGQYRVPTQKKCADCPDCGRHGTCGPEGCKCTGGYSGKLCQTPPVCVKGCAKVDCSCFSSPEADRGACKIKAPTTTAKPTTTTPKPVSTKMDMRIAGVNLYNDLKAREKFRKLLATKLFPNAKAVSVDATPDGFVSVVVDYTSKARADAGMSKAKTKGFESTILQELQKADSEAYQNVKIDSYSAAAYVPPPPGDGAVAGGDEKSDSDTQLSTGGAGVIAALVVVILLLLGAGGGVAVWFLLTKMRSKVKMEKTPGSRKAVVVVQADDSEEQQEGNGNTLAKGEHGTDE